MDRTLTFPRHALPTAPTLDLSVIMPCRNENDALEPMLREWDHVLKENIDSYEILVINDGSSDGTGRVLDRLRREMKHLRVIHQLNAGHGKSIRRGYDLARGKFVLQVNADGCFEVSDFLRLWEQRDASMVLAVRTRRIDSIPRQLMNYAVTFLTNVTFGIQLSDPDVPFRLLRRETLHRHMRSLDGAAESLNVLLAARIAREQPTQIREVPVPFRMRNDRAERGSIFHGTGRCIALCGDIVRYRLNPRRYGKGQRTAPPILAGT